MYCGEFDIIYNESVFDEKMSYIIVTPKYKFDSVCGKEKKELSEDVCLGPIPDDGQSSENKDDKENYMTIYVVAIVFGVLAVLVIVVAVIIMYKKQLGCFKPKNEMMNDKPSKTYHQSLMEDI